MKYGREEIKPTARFIEAIKELIWAEMEMMRLSHPEKDDCWAWGMCTIGDLQYSKFLEFKFGSEEDKPTGFPGQTNVWVKL